MKFSPTQLAFAALLAIVYGVSFSIAYPLVEIGGGIVALCVLLGIVTSLAVAPIWNALERSNIFAAHKKHRARRAGTNPPARHPSRRKR